MPCVKLRVERGMRVIGRLLREELASRSEVVAVVRPQHLHLVHSQHCVLRVRVPPRRPDQRTRDRDARQNHNEYPEAPSRTPTTPNPHPLSSHHDKYQARRLFTVQGEYHTGPNALIRHYR